MSVVPTIDGSLVRRLIAEQFPHWSQLEVRPVESDGWDNRSFRLSAELSARLPSAAPYAPQVAKEVRWLPVLADVVSLPIPEVVGVGVSGAGYPFPWTIRRWIDGTPLAGAPLTDRKTLAADLAGFLGKLQHADRAGPVPWAHSAGRGPLHQWDEQTRRALSSLRDRVDVGSALPVWQDALEAGAAQARSSVWFHGDVAPGTC
ncbi:phosphotransferase [Rhodococcus triatomae]|uniref:Phosphotransferase enzyme family protein n=1 Tax=Rhodococcus triatomae TaxID=300028 RepID=A0A1G8AH53_9NOCA|nr:phosphotransferase [Rhodococcus triatomae]QNG17767.1 phosphotransferase [Rhodococcus triatomae]QNG22565.1 phosphotransferase [Rhodococcus triatomae]SDH20335.1 Phosphotransferase enzyme family protein [Rhodococcus triatomae]